MRRLLIRTAWCWLPIQPQSGRGIRTIGWSHSASRIIAVITLVDKGHVYGVNGWVANSSDQRLYREEAGDE